VFQQDPPTIPAIVRNIVERLWEVDLFPMPAGRRVGDQLIYYEGNKFPVNKFPSYAPYLLNFLARF